MADITTEELLGLLNQSEKTDLAVMIQAKENAKRAALDDPSKAGEVLRAEDTLQRFLKRMAADKVGSPGNSNEVFEKKIEAYRYLHEEQGFKLGKSKFYADLASGKWVGQDGVILKSRMDEYAFEKELSLRPEIIKAQDEIKQAQQTKARLLDECNQRKLLASTNREELKEERERLELDQLKGNTMSRQDHELTLASFITAVDSSIKQRFQDEAKEVIEMSGGRPDREHEVKKRLDRMWDETLSEFAGTGVLEVSFYAASEPDTD